MIYHRTLCMGWFQFELKKEQEEKNRKYFSWKVLYIEWMFESVSSFIWLYIHIFIIFASFLFYTTNVCIQNIFPVRFGEKRNNNTLTSHNRNSSQRAHAASKQTNEWMNEQTCLIAVNIFTRALNCLPTLSCCRSLSLIPSLLSRRN